MNSVGGDILATHHLLTEIMDQGAAARNALEARIAGGRNIKLEELGFLKAQPPSEVILAGCGSGYYACLLGQIVIERLTGISAKAVSSSELLARKVHADHRSLAILVSQSGETSQTLDCLLHLKTLGARTVAVVNVANSSIGNEADGVIDARAGVESAVPSTKAWLAQTTCLYLIAGQLAELAGRDTTSLVYGLQNLPEAIEDALGTSSEVKSLSEELSSIPSWYLIGQGLDLPIVLEGALKIKEVAYIHAEAIPAGELRHGPIALLDKGMPVIAVASQPSLRSWTEGALRYATEAGARTVMIRTGLASGASQANVRIDLPAISDLLAPLLCVIPLQLLSYFTGVARGVNVDAPRHLSKSVSDD